MQCDNCTISESVDIWIDLLSAFPTNNKTLYLYENLCSIKDKVIARSEQALGCPFFLAAHILDHRYCGKRLKPAQLVLGRQFINDENPEVAESLTAYLSRVHHRSVCCLFRIPHSMLRCSHKN